MKIDIRLIVSDHFETLTDKVSGKISWIDTLVFIALPGTVGLFSAYMITDLPFGIYGVLVSVFAVFAALLFSAQISIFNFFQNLKGNEIRKIDRGSISETMLSASRERQGRLLRELNLNISYLILLCCVSLILLLLFNLFLMNGYFATFFLVFLVAHFFLTLLLVIKRGHIAFKIQYE